LLEVTAREILIIEQAAKKQARRLKDYRNGDEE
jgi:hypothetical protein